MSNQKISVLTSVFKSERDLRPAVESVLAQTYKDFEWIIINDATPDNSIKIIESYNDPRIKIFDNATNLGLAASLNKGLDLCQTEYVLRMDTDDICYPNRFERQVKYMDENPEIAIAGSWVKLIGDWKGYWKPPTEHEEIKCKMLFNSSIAHPSVILRKSELDKHNLRYNEKLRRIQDYDLWVRAAEKMKLANIPEVLMDYRIDIPAKSPEVVKTALEVIYGIRSRQLKKEDLSLSPYEMDNLHYISANEYKKADVKTLAGMFEKLVAANSKAKEYDQNVLENTVGKMWLQLLMKKPLSAATKSIKLLGLSLKAGLKKISG